MEFIPIANPRMTEDEAKAAYDVIKSGWISMGSKVEEFENNITKWDNVKYSPDFYSTSGVRDLLFHVQEHRFTIKKIRSYINKLGLVFLGFEDTYVLDRFKKKYYQINDLYNLDLWNKFELDNPRIFAGMYQFWCKKI